TQDERVQVVTPGARRIRPARSGVAAARGTSRRNLAFRNRSRAESAARRAPAAATFRDMTENRPLQHVRLIRLIAWLRSRGVWFWATAGAATSVTVLVVGSQIAHDRGQSV